MDVTFRDDVSQDDRERLRKLFEIPEGGVPFDEAKMRRVLDHDAVESVRVFRLRKGMVIRVQGTKYKVTAARPNGKVTLKPV